MAETMEFDPEGSRKAHDALYADTLEKINDHMGVPDWSRALKAGAHALRTRPPERILPGNLAAMAIRLERAAADETVGGSLVDRELLRSAASAFRDLLADRRTPEPVRAWNDVYDAWIRSPGFASDEDPVYKAAEFLREHHREVYGE